MRNEHCFKIANHECRIHQSIMTNVSIRPATEADMPAVFRLVEALAEYERAADQVKTSPAIYLRDGFGDRPWFHSLVATRPEEGIVGMALYYFAYSTWKGRMIFLEDFVVAQTHRRQGIGRRLIDALVEVALRHDVQLLKWEVLDWNQPAIDMYRSLGSQFDEGWIDVKIFRDQMDTWEPMG